MNSVVSWLRSLFHKPVSRVPDSKKEELRKITEAHLENESKKDSKSCSQCCPGCETPCDINKKNDYKKEIDENNIVYEMVDTLVAVDAKDLIVIEPVVDPLEVAPVEVAPVEVAPVEVAPVEVIEVVKPVEVVEVVKPVEVVEVVEVAPVEVAPVEVVEVTPEVAPVEVAPVEVAPVEVAPVEVASVEVTPAEVVEPVKVAPVEVAPVEVAAVEVAPAEVVEPVEVAPVEVVETVDAHFEHVNTVKALDLSYSASLEKSGFLDDFTYLDNAPAPVYSEVDSSSDLTPTPENEIVNQIIDEVDSNKEVHFEVDLMD